MHDIKWIRENPDAFDRALKRRGLPDEAARLISIDERRRATIAKAEQAQARRNAASQELDAALAQIPNLPLAEVPDGADEHGNVEHHKFGAKRDYAFTPKQHFELGEALGQMDFETAAKLSGARFVVLKKGLARLERALGQFMLDLHTGEHGYTEVNPPLLVLDDVMFGTAQLPKFADDQFFATRTIARTELLHDALKYARAEDQEEFRQGKLDLE